MRWDMTVLRESPWYQEILQEGERRGRQEGLEREQQLILKQLARRVGELPPERVVQVQALSSEQLESLGEALLDFTAIPDLENWLTALPHPQPSP